MGHESYQRQDEVRGSSDRAFGLVFAGVFAIIGLLPLILGGHLRLWAVGIAIGFAAVALVMPRLLAPANRLWTRFGLLLHRIVSPLVLAIMFFVAITPTGLLMRLLGKDPLRLRFESDRPSYWIDRVPPGPSPESLEDQF